MQVGVLGPLIVTVNGQSVPFRSAKQRLLLVALVSHPNTPIAMQKLFDALWEEPPPSAKENLRLYIYHLRRMLGGVGRIVRHPSGYALMVDEDELDVHRFEKLAAEGAHALAAGNPAQASESLTQALALWRGPAYDDLAETPFLRHAALRLEEARLLATEQRIQADLALGKHADLVGELTAMVATHPTRERLRAHLMLALYRTGRQADALERYREGRRILVEELGLEPGTDLIALHEAILKADRSLEPHAVDGAPPEPTRLFPIPAQLPPDIADFIGRDHELAEFDRLLDRRLSRGVPAFLGVTGMGGVGKTGLAVRWANRVARRFPDGQLYVDLRGYSEHIEPLSPHGVIDRFLRALGIPGTRVPDDLDERSGLLRSMLAQRRVLMVLDNAHNSAQVRPLLPGSPTCAVIITSRDSLDGLVSQEGAQVVRLGTLAPSDALAVLAEVAGASWLRGDPAAARLSELCNGLPLALRIVGARLANRSHLTAAYLADRFADERQRLNELSHGDTQLRSHFDLSYRGLAPRVASLFRRLALLDMTTFEGWVSAALLDADVETAHALTEQLVAAQLLEVNVHDQARRPRYRFHDLVRLYARERALEEEPEAERTAALARAYGGLLALAEQAHGRLYGGDFAVIHGDAPRWRADQRLVSDLLEDPLDWFDGERPDLIRAVSQTAALGLDDLSWDLAMSCVALFEAHSHLDDWQTTHETALDAVRRAGNRRGEAAMVYGLGSLALYRQRYAEARTLLENACELFAEMAEDHGYALALRNLALLERTTGQVGPAATHYDEALSLLRRAGDRAAEANVLIGMAQISLDRGRLDSAESLLEEALRSFQTIGNWRGEAQAQYRLGEVHLRQRRFEEAAQAFSAAFPLVRRLHDLLGEAFLSRGLGQAQLELGLASEAEHSLTSALKIARALDEPFAEASASLALGTLYGSQSDTERAEEHINRALRLFREMDNAPWRARALRALAKTKDDQGDHARARELWSEAYTLLSALGSPEAQEVAALLSGPARVTPDEV
ncbi:BTAD domain-containing putative transcriptional regulator [Sphaerisporangium flaviroseum]|uniref:BTAD domain-containing putative transcriptional regulator n=1 Tax=Sphaerisporangium flaviroseum TaxID=509199 RepID=A0ABP7IE00_9ACTN